MGWKGKSKSVEFLINVIQYLIWECEWGNIIILGLFFFSYHGMISKNFL